MPLPNYRIVQNQTKPRAARQPERTGIAQHHKPNVTSATVKDKKAQGEIVADQAAHKTRRGEDLVQPSGVLFNGMRSLGKDKEQEHELAPVLHKTHRAC